MKVKYPRGYSPCSPTDRLDRRAPVVPGAGQKEAEMTISTQVQRAGEGAGAPPAGVTLEYEKGSLPLPVHPATDGPSGLDVSKLLSQTGHVTLDVGFANTAACTSAITYIDGDAGILRYRGYPIEQLAQKSSFLEVSYLLIYGELPTSEQLAGFTARIKEHTLLREEMRRFFDGFPRDAHPMAVLSSAVSALSTFYQDSLDPLDRDQDPRAAIVKKAAQEIVSRTAAPDPLLDIAMRLEEIALSDDYFIERKLYPNVDFYTGLIYKAMGFPAEMFTVLFALGRLPGWIGQWREMMADPATKIGRPRQVYTGAAERPYVPIANR